MDQTTVKKDELPPTYEEATKLAELYPNISHKLPTPIIQQPTAPPIQISSSAVGEVQPAINQNTVAQEGLETKDILQICDICCTLCLCCLTCFL